MTWLVFLLNFFITLALIKMCLRWVFAFFLLNTYFIHIYLKSRVYYILFIFYKFYFIPLYIYTWFSYFTFILINIYQKIVIYCWIVFRFYIRHSPFEDRLRLEFLKFYFSVYVLVYVFTWKEALASIAYIIAWELISVLEIIFVLPFDIMGRLYEVLVITVKVNTIILWARLILYVQSNTYEGGFAVLFNFLGKKENRINVYKRIFLMCYVKYFVLRLKYFKTGWQKEEPKKKKRWKR